MKSLLTCKACSATVRSELSDAYIIVCGQCKNLVHQPLTQNVLPSKIPDDWSFVQIGSTFEFGNQLMRIVGRIRLQLRNDYKNFWCAVLPSGTHVWLMESFASFAILSGTWLTFNQSVNKLYAGGTVTLNDRIKLKGEYVEKCEGISFEGELGEWRLMQPGFFFIQCSDNKKNTTVFIIDGRHNIYYLSGGKVELEKLNLTNILAWDEWK